MVAYVLYNLTYAGMSYPAGRVSDRVPRRNVFAASLAVFAIVYLGLGVVTTSAWVWPLLAGYGAALTDGVGKAWISDLLASDRYGSGLGLYEACAAQGRSRPACGRPRVARERATSARHLRIHRT